MNNREEGIFLDCLQKDDYTEMHLIVGEKMHFLYSLTTKNIIKIDFKIIDIILHMYIKKRLA